MPFYKNSLRPKFSFKACVEVDISSKKLHPKKYFQEESRHHIHDEIFRHYLTRSILSVSFKGNITKFANTCKSHACADVANFKLRCVKVSLLNLCSECQNFVKKTPSHFEDIKNVSTKFPRSEKFLQSGMRLKQ